MASEMYSLADELLADRLCDRLENGWRGVPRPRIEELLPEAPPAVRELVLEQLLRSEIGMRLYDGEAPTEQEYLQRFPTDEALVKEVCGATLPQPGETVTALFAASETVTVKKPAPASDALPRRFGDYELLAQLGAGGMGVVYKARQITANRLVALKLVRPDQLASYAPEDRQRLLARFRNEIQAAARLEHDHVVTVYDVGEVDGQSYYAMRLVEGDSLKDRLAKGPLEPEVATRYIEQVARALAEAHAKGILHRDLKPHNVMIDRRTNRALLTDFGLAKLSQQDQELTAHGAVFGSPPYMSPEQAVDAGNVAASSDIYGLGATLYHLLTGRPPFHAASHLATLQQVQTVEPTSPRSLNPAVPLDLETICLKCLEKKPAARFASAVELADRLALVLRGEPIPERPLSRQAKVWRWCKRNPTVAMLSGGLAVLVIAIAVVSPIVAIKQHRLALDLENSLEETKRASTSEQESLLQLLLSLDRNQDPSARLRAGFKKQAIEELKSNYPRNPSASHQRAFNSIAVDYMTAAGVTHAADLLPGEPMYCLTFDAAGKRLAAARHQGLPGGLTTNVFVFDVATQAQLMELEFQSVPPNPTRPNGARSIAFSADPQGRWLVVGDRYGTVHCWDLSAEPPVHYPLAAHGAGAVTNVAFSANGDLYTAGEDLALRRWKPGDSGKPFEPVQFKKFADKPQFSLLPDGELLVTANDAVLLSAETLEPIGDAATPLAGTRGLWRSAAIGRANAAAIPATRLSLVDRETGTVVQEFLDPRGQDAVGSDRQMVQLSASADGALLAGADAAGFVRLWDVPTGRLITELPAGAPGSNAVAISPRGEFLAMTSALNNENCVSVWRITGRDLHRPLAVSRGVIHDFGVLTNGSPAVLTSTDRGGRIAVRVIDSAEDRPLNRMVVKTHFEGPPPVLAIDPSSPTLRHTGTGREAFAWNLQYAKQRKGLDEPSIRLIEHSPDGVCWVVRDSNDLGIWDAAGAFQPRWDNQAMKLTVGRARVHAVAAGSKWLAVGAAAGLAVLFERQPGEQLAERARFDLLSAVTAAALDPQEQQLIVGTEEGKLGIVQIPGAGPPVVLDAHASRIESIAFQPDGRLLATTGDDHQIVLWRRDDKQIVQALSLRPRLGPLARVRFSPNGARLYALAKGGFALHVWDLDQLAARFQKEFGRPLLY